MKGDVVMAYPHEIESIKRCEPVDDKKDHRCKDDILAYSLMSSQKKKGGGS